MVEMARAKQEALKDNTRVPYMIRPVYYVHISVFPLLKCSLCESSFALITTTGLTLPANIMNKSRFRSETWVQVSSIKKY